LKNYWGIETSGIVCTTLQTQSVIAWYEFPVIRLKEVGWVTRVADLFTYLGALFVSAFSSSEYIALRGRVISELWIWKNVDESSCFLIWGTLVVYSWKGLGNPEEMAGKVATSRARF